MNYSLTTKLSVLQQVSQGMSIAEASQFYKITQQTIRKWAKAPDNCFHIKLAPHTKYSIEQKIEILRLYEESDLSIKKFSDLYAINYTTVRDWIRDKERLLAVYSSRRQSPVKPGIVKNSGKEAGSVPITNDNDTQQHIRDLKDENEYLKARVAYLEALMEINGTPVSGFKKKRNTRPSTRSSEGELET